MQLIPDYWETRRLYIRDAIMDQDLEYLQSLYDKSAYIGKWDNHRRNVEDQYIFRCLTEGDLPPNGRKELFKVQPIFHKESNEMMGLIFLYHGYPSPDILWIAFFFISQEYQAQKYGQEVIQQLFHGARGANYTKVRLGVALKNWPALRFWTRLGFNRIIGVFGDPIHSEYTFSSVVLEASL
ncbi:GNAT family N-acetyltransferase [Thermoflavimicrobium dichotomicum]|uniref:Acetyltransferase (GNAT) family protein n=1 Tax=Thermoflavimicrobium dichotomicum TaxID=46223 RepID=A0A1I3P5S6_9BACL|nr:GNAT family N-acetyltransferase [Thermoflavimicrobium dichotomicum]SFJ16751.1 Acetyltransferase (GNAT) family protein [Thermoflavimicrobium dichotomicum]